MLVSIRRYALGYMLLISSSWLIYFLVTGVISETDHWPTLCMVLGALMLSVTIVLFITYTDIYNNHMLLISLIVAFVLCIISLSFIVLVPVKTDITSDISPVGHFSICIEILMVIYTLIPLKLYMSIVIGLFYSSAFEILTVSLQKEPFDAATITVRLLSHLCIHLIGLHILVMSNVRIRNTFMKVRTSNSMCSVNVVYVEISGWPELARATPARIREEAQREHDPLAHAG